MNKKILHSLTKKERRLVAETERDAMADLDEDHLLELHTRIRRVRTKYVHLYRRPASAQVSAKGGRGHAYATNQRNRDKAEIFETALARVSRQVDAVAKQAAAELRAERLAAAGKKRGSRPAVDGVAPGPDETATRRHRAAKTTGGKKRDASTQAKGARRQAKRDSR